MKNLNLLYLVSFIEGSALMSAEILSAKIMGPYYGSSLIVWTSVFICTLSGLALGYYFGGKLSNTKNLNDILLKIVLFSTLMFFLMSPLSTFMMEITLSFPIEIGSLLSVLIFLFPLLISFGMVSPIIIQLLTKNIQDSGKNSGNVYTISTVGGILTTLFIGFHAIPNFGIKLSILFTAFALLIASLLVIYIKNMKITA
jgi:hypothetical protein